MLTVSWSLRRAAGDMQLRLRVLLLALLFACVSALGGSLAHAASAQTSPPGPILGTGDFITTSNRIATASWEEYAGGMLYLWNTTYVTQAYAGGCSFSGSAVCYKWIQYTWSLADPYNSSLWVPFQRGCMVLGADPLVVGEADGNAEITDIYAAGTTHIAVNRPLEGDATLNPAASGVAGAPAVASLPAPWTYDGNCGAGGAAGSGGGGCSSSWAGTWSTSYGNMQLSQSGATVTGTYEDNGGRITGIAAGNTLSGTWSEQPSYTAPDDAGDFRFTLSADGTFFSGGWRYGSMGSFTTDWTGTRTCTMSGGGGGGSPSQCTISGSWQTLQSGYLAITFTFQQSGTTVTGSASAPSLNLKGPLSGTLIGNQLSVVVTWNPTLQGAYMGTVSPGQITNGSSYQVGKPPSSAVSWSGTGPATCGGSSGGGSTGSGSDISGIWDANNGVWTFTQSGGSVTVSIAFSGGNGTATAQGTISNGTVQLTYSCNGICGVVHDQGTVTLTLSSSGCSMQGTYTNVNHDSGSLTMTKRGCS